VADQDAAFNLVEITRQVSPYLERAELVLTHAFEGGHPDHDATAFAVHAAVALLRHASHAPSIIEFPLYRAGPDGGWIRQAFEAGSTEHVVRLTAAERDRKACMIAVFTSQQHTLRFFGPADERFRPAPAYDFPTLQNDGDLLYERYGWLTGARWRELAVAAQIELGLEQPA
jgi:LmbE family N-acetylglucosaminyl deacetylase